MKKLMIGLLAACLPLAASSMSSWADPSTKDWPAYGHDAGGGRFSPLTQITPDNVSKLAVAWTYHMTPAGYTGRPRLVEAIPIVVGDSMYITSSYGEVIALNATTGAELRSGLTADLDGLVCDRTDARVDERAGERLVGGDVQIREEDQPLAKPAVFRLDRLLDLEDEVGALPHLVDGDDPRTDALVVGIRERAAGAGALLDRDVVPAVA